MNALPNTDARDGDCWNRIGVRGDRSCPELEVVGHCHNCPVFARAGRQFLDAVPPSNYLEEWTSRLAAPPEQVGRDLLGVLTFRLAEEWLGLPVQALIEVTPPRPVHRVPHRRGLLAGLVNIRGELHLCVHLDRLLGLRARDPGSDAAGRLLVTEWAGQHWVFPVDEVDQVHRIDRAELTPAPPTVALAEGRLTAGVFPVRDRSVGLLDADRLFGSLQGKIR